MLTNDQLEQYRRYGYIVPDFRFSGENPRADTPRGPRPIAREASRSFANYCPNVLAFDLSPSSTTPGCPRVLDMVEQILGPDFALWNSSFFAKPALNGYATPWHQDGEYWPIRPLATCTAWIAVDEATRENGCLRFIRGSHRDRTPALPPHQLEPRPHPQPGAERLGVRRERCGGSRARGGADLAPRRISRARLGGEPLPASAPRHDPSLHADDVGVRPGDRRPAPSWTRGSWTTPIAPCS